MEFASKSRLAFRGQSYVFVGFTAALPFILLVSFLKQFYCDWTWNLKLLYKPTQMSIIDGIVRLDSSFGGVMTIMGRSILCLPWVALLLGPLYVTVCHYRHLPCSKVEYFSKRPIGWKLIYMYLIEMAWIVAQIWLRRLALPTGSAGRRKGDGRVHLRATWTSE